MKLPTPTAHQGLGPSSSYAGEPRYRTEALVALAPAWELAPQSAAPDAASPGPTAPLPYVYMVSSGIRVRFPSMSVEKALRQALPVDEADLPITQELLFRVLGDPQNLYIAREMCWIAVAQGLDIYVVIPRSHDELLRLIAAVSPRKLPQQSLLTVLTGARGPIAPASLCNGAELPTLMCTRVNNYTAHDLAASIANAINKAYPDDSVTADDLTIKKMCSTMFALANTSGDTPDKRALGYVATSYMEPYVQSYALSEGLGSAKGAPEQDALEQPVITTKYALASVTTGRAPVQGDRLLVEVIFHYQKVTEGADAAPTVLKSCAVDVTGATPFIDRGFGKYLPSPF